MQFFCALPLLLIAGGLIYLEHTASNGLHSSYYGNGRLYGGAVACLILASRCLWYAVTGKDNVNRDDFD